MDRPQSFGHYPKPIHADERQNLFLLEPSISHEIDESMITRTNHVSLDVELTTKYKAANSNHAISSSYYRSIEGLENLVHIDPPGSRPNSRRQTLLIWLDGIKFPQVNGNSRWSIGGPRKHSVTAGLDCKDTLVLFDDLKGSGNVYSRGRGDDAGRDHISLER
jgi:hypothetical protein